jgi:hypothetical protein
MNRFWWWCAGRVSRLLDSAEREAVYGDFAESGETGVRALLGMLGLVARRQIAYWNDWRPWLALAGLIIPFGVLLSLVSRQVAGWSSTYLWLYFNNWRADDLWDAGFRVLAVQSAIALFSTYALLGCSSWSVGLALGSASRRTVPTNSALFSLVFLAGAWLGGLSSNPALRLSGRTIFYGSIYPGLILIALALLPCFWGMGHGLEMRAQPRVLRSSLWIAAVITLALLVTRSLALLPIHSAFFSQMAYSDRSLALRLQPIAFWPVAYWAATRFKRRRLAAN